MEELTCDPLLDLMNKNSFDDNFGIEYLKLNAESKVIDDFLFYNYDDYYLEVEYE